MKSTLRWMVTVAVISTIGANAALFSRKVVKEEVEEEPTAASSYEARQKAEAAARSKDPTWKPACAESDLIRVGEGNSKGTVKNFCLNKEGNILVCYSPVETSKSSEKNKPGIRVYSPEGKLLKTMPLEIRPSAICVDKEGAIYTAGEGRVLKLDGEGKVLASGVSPVASIEVKLSDEVKEMVKENAKQNRQSFEKELAQMQASLEKRRADVTGIAVTGEDVFMAVPSPNDFSYRVYRMDSSLTTPKLVVEKLRGCCGQMDIQAHDGKLWIPHNARHAIESRDREGKEVLKFGKAGKVKPSDFGGCCEPKNMRVLTGGDILVAESGPPTCIKRFSSAGKFKEVVAVVDGAKGDCVRVTVEMSPDGSRYYMLDTTRDAIRVFKTKT